MDDRTPCHDDASTGGGEQILVVEDDRGMRESCRQALEHGDFRVFEASSPREAEPILLRETLALVVSDLRMPDGGGQEVVRLVRNVSPDLAVILITAYPTVESAVEAFKSGVVDYLLKPFTGNQLLEAVNRALGTSRVKDRAALLRRLGAQEPMLADLIGSSARFHDCLTEIRRVAPLEGQVLVWGETGSGKELVASAIHRFSRRARGPFVVVNCAALPENLLEAEVFGFEKGAFTGASVAKPGLIEHANGGSLFLDEVGDLTPAAQAKLLRCLEDRTCRRVGGLESRPVDVRIIAATNKDLREEIRANRFREDFFYRLSTLEVHVPPLRDRPEDIPQLATAFLDRLDAEREAGSVVGFSDEAFDLMIEYAWPGNVRELQNAIQRAFARTGGPVIDSDDLVESGALGVPEQVGRGRSARRHTAVADFERRYLAEALQRHGGKITRTAQALSIHRTTLYRLLKKHGIHS